MTADPTDEKIRYRHTHDTTHLVVPTTEDLQITAKLGYTVRVYNIALTETDAGARRVRVDGQHIRPGGKPATGQIGERWTAPELLPARLAAIVEDARPGWWSGDAARAQVARLTELLERGVLINPSPPDRVTDAGHLRWDDEDESCAVEATAGEVFDGDRWFGPEAADRQAGRLAAAAREARRPAPQQIHAEEVTR